jgi:putative heme transporter
VALDQARRSARQRWQRVRARADERRAGATVMAPWEVAGSSLQPSGSSAPDSGSTAPPTLQPDELVPPSVRYAAAWSWRILVIAAAVALLGWVAWQVRVVTFPLVVAVLLAALLAPTVQRLRRAGWSRGASAGSVLGGFLVLVIGVLTFVGQQVGGQFSQVADQATRGIDEIQAWLAEGPLQLSQEQISNLVDQVTTALSSSQDRLAAGALSTAGAAAEVFAGIAIALFAGFFFLFDGRSIWRWLVALAPSAVKADVDKAGRLAFGTLIGYVRSTVVVSTFDGVFVTIWLLILSVPLALPLGVLVFFGGFVPLVGAFVSGGIAVLVAFVTQGPIVALLVLAGIVAVQQIEAHLFAPLVMGRMVRLHPLAIVLAVSVGGVVFGIIGAVVAVPLVAVVNTVASYLSSRWGSPSPTAPLEVSTDASPPARTADAPAPVESGQQE